MKPNLNPRAPRSKLVLIKALKRSIETSEVDGAHAELSASNDVIGALTELNGRIEVGPDPFRRCRDGERTDHLTTLLGRWYYEGKTLDEATLLALAWNTRNLPPLSDDKVLRTAASMLETHKRNHPSASNEATIVKSLFDLDTARVDCFLDYDPPPRKWLLNDCLPLGKVGLLVAPGGTGKSQFALQLAIAVATGEPLAGYWEVGEPGPVLGLFAEEDHDELHRRMSAILRARTSISEYEYQVFANKLRKNLFLKPMMGENCLMTKADAKRSVSRTDVAERVVATIRDLPDIRLVIMDPASRFRGGDENAAEDATRFVEAAELITRETGVTVLLLHHVNKSSSKDGEQTANASRGSSALSDGIRWQMNLALLTEDDAKKLCLEDEARKGYLSTKVTKNNYGPTGDVVYLRRGDHGVLSHCDLQKQVPRSRTDKIKAVVDLVRAGAAKGELLSKSAFAQTHGGRQGALKMGINAAQALINVAIKEGYLVHTAGKGRHLVATDKPFGLAKAKVFAAGAYPHGDY